MFHFDGLFITIEDVKKSYKIFKSLKFSEHIEIRLIDHPFIGVGVEFSREISLKSKELFISSLLIELQDYKILLLNGTSDLSENVFQGQIYLHKSKVFESTQFGKILEFFLCEGEFINSDYFLPFRPGYFSGTCYSLKYYSDKKPYEIIDDLYESKLFDIPVYYNLAGETDELSLKSNMSFKILPIINSVKNYYKLEHDLGLNYDMKIWKHDDSIESETSVTNLVDFMIKTYSFNCIFTKDDNILIKQKNGMKEIFVK